MEKLNVIITGSTGMVGKGVLLECLDSPDVESVLVVNRSPIDIKHPKMKEVLIQNLVDPESKWNLKGYNACFYCMGITSVGASEEHYTHIMHDLTMVFAEAALSVNPDMTFCFVSGAGTDSTEKGRQMWARVKGRTENDLLKLGFKKAYMFRPGLILPKRGIRSRTGWYNFFYTVTKPIAFIFKRMPKYVTDTITLGKAMIKVCTNGYSTSVLESLDINKAGAS
ncbi:MAG: epimerase [Saprospiraceae bacterium]|uniref:Epimerase n=1 Tax=Candidatus Opimibacter skivensis TaxID=2982028 RepID=A0A9D7SRM0_9BACT|nr:epimerase [Candidatus Opimibacter skivensis]